MMSETITIPGELPNLNEIIKASKAHYMAYANMKKTHTETITWIAKSEVKGKYNKIDLDVTWVCRDRRQDKDNIMAGGLKFILDGLVQANVIENDGWRHIGDIVHRFKVDKKRPRIEVKITEAGQI